MEGQIIESKANAFLMLSDYPPLLALFVFSLLVVICFVTVIVIAKFNPGLFNKLHDSRKIKLPNGREINDRRKEKRREDDKHNAPCLSSKCGIQADIESLKEKIDELFNIVADNEDEQKSISIGTLENMLFNENMPMMRRQKAYYRLIGKKKNGRIKEKGYKLITEDKEMWRDILDLNMDIEIEDQEFFNATLADINKQIFNGFM